MRLAQRLLRIPRPKTFLYFTTLRTGTELATLALLLNKVTGLYGLLALLTGLHLSPAQFSMYIYSVLALLLVTYLARHIRTQSPFECLALATFFAIDSLVNAAYTAVFGLTWFLVISQHRQQQNDSSSSGQPGVGGKTMGDAAGFTKPEHNVSHVDVMVPPNQNIPGHSQEAVTAGNAAGEAASTRVGNGSLGGAVLQPESMSSIFVICLLWAVRLYLVLVVMAYARVVLRRYVSNISRNNTALYSGNKDANVMENPFGEQSPAGKGWKGKLGRVMIALNQDYWLGVHESDDASWADGEAVALGRMRKAVSGVAAASGGESGSGGESPGLGERERRRRSGTGPPPPPPSAPQFDSAAPGQHLRVHEIRDGKR